jgi:hypothetical protein
MWSLNENKIKTNKMGRKNQSYKGCGVLVLSHGEEEETIENESPIITKFNI